MTYDKLESVIDAAWEARDTVKADTKEIGRAHV